MLQIPKEKGVFSCSGVACSDFTQIYQLNVHTVKMLAHSPVAAPSLNCPVFPDLSDNENETVSKGKNLSLLSFSVKCIHV